MKPATKYIAVGLTALGLIGSGTFYFINHETKVADNKAKITSEKESDSKKSAQRDAAKKDGSAKADSDASGKKGAEGNSGSGESVGAAGEGAATASAGTEGYTAGGKISGYTLTSSGSISGGSGSGSRSESGSAGGGSSTVAPKPAGNGGKTDDYDTTAGVSDEKSRKTIEKIKQNHLPAFLNLQAKADAEINSILNAASAEYQTMKNNGTPMSFDYFMNKYEPRASAAEAKIDGQFFDAYNEMRDDLIRKKVSPAAADEFRQVYMAEKQARRDAILAQASALFN
ncbi:hypothetical protein ACFQPF_05535 [Fictibacillus iocasae]|uniref:Uncharacterized protein n=1 Tax=Fictibacillus iocasae TaxID=2715437 RepID=A0ABW2NKD7_9BACL